jgi:hypothetical protein
LVYMGLTALLLTGFYPVHHAWKANQKTTLHHAVAWACIAWAAWCLAAALNAASPGAVESLWRYFALCLTGCAAVAVLGARRPGAAAWNMVVAGLLAVLLLPVAIQLGEVRLNAFDAAFLSGALAVGLLNHLPTRLASAALPVGAACALEMCILLGTRGISETWADMAALGLLALAPWAGLGALRRPRPGADDVDREWLAFRDRFGMVWALPAREQFNRAAANGQWGVVLEWQGLRLAGDSPARPEAALAGLRAVLKRFGPNEESLS